MSRHEPDAGGPAAAEETGDFRYRGLWLWNPVSCVSRRGYDEPHMFRHGDWFFDRDLMTRYFDAMFQAGLNTWVLANTHPFPFMVDMRGFPDARLLADADLSRYQNHYHWLFETARGKGIKPFVLFHTCYVPDSFGIKHGIEPGHDYEPPPLVCEYTRYCVRQLCDTYPELEGINGEASENVAPDLRAEFAEKAVIAGIHESSRKPVLFFRGWMSDPDAMKRHVLDAYRGECFFTVKYTWEFLIHRRPDPEFMRWVKTCGAERVLPEFWISNYQPFGCHDVELAAGIRHELHRLGCRGFTSHPMDLYGSPFVQGDPGRHLQLERDRDWYATLSGAWSDGTESAARRFGIGEADDLARAMRCASRPHRMIACYVTGNKQNFLQPQVFAAMIGSPEGRAGLHTFAQWEEHAERVDASFGRWMEQIDGVKVRYPGESGEGFNLDDLLAGLDRVDAEWPEALPRATKDAEVYEVWLRDLRAQRTMARAWAERARAVVAHFEGDAAQVESALRRSLELLRTIPDILGCDGPYRLLVGRHAIVISWSDVATALTAEIESLRRGRPPAQFPFGSSTRR